jgi:hypothetical protein
MLKSPSCPKVYSDQLSKTLLEIFIIVWGSEDSDLRTRLALQKVCAWWRFAKIVDLHIVKACETYMTTMIMMMMKKKIGLQPLSPHQPQPLSPHQPQPLSPHQPQPLSPHQPQPLSSQQSQPLSSQQSHPLSPQQPQPLSSQLPQPPQMLSHRDLDRQTTTPRPPRQQHPEKRQHSNFIQHTREHHLSPPPKKRVSRPDVDLRPQAVRDLMDASNRTRPAFLDAIFLRNNSRRRQARVPTTRQWYPVADKWLALHTLAAVAAEALDTAEGGPAPLSMSTVEIALLGGDDDDDDTCAISGEPLERYYDPKSDKWFYKDAVRLTGVLAEKNGVREGSTVKVQCLVRPSAPLPYHHYATASSSAASSAASSASFSPTT